MLYSSVTGVHTQSQRLDHFNRHEPDVVFFGSGDGEQALRGSSRTADGRQMVVRPYLRHLLSRRQSSLSRCPTRRGV